MNTEIALDEFRLIGHDCPLGIYPSMVVPVGVMKNKVAVAYAGKEGVVFEAVASNSFFTRYDQSTIMELGEFDVRTHGLFAISETEILIYRLGEEPKFFQRILTSSIAFRMDPFYRFSLAIETNRISLMRPIYQSCIRRFDRNAPECREQWIIAMAQASPVCEALVRHESRVERETTPRARSVAFLQRFENELFVNQREVVVDGKKINDAANNLVRQSDDSLLPKENRYSKALQLSLGSWALGSEGSSHVPSPVDVARISGLSLPHLEVLNIVLSKRTAEEFLEMATGVNAAAMVKKYVRYTNYRERFLRPVAKVNRRLLFTFAEILSLIGYSGPATS